MIFAGLGMKLALAAGGVALIVAAFFYVQSLRANLRTLEETNLRMESVITAQKEQNEVLTSSLATIRKLNEDIQSRFRTSEREVSSLKAQFEAANGKMRDLQAIALKKPELIEQKINQGTIYALRCNEIVTGAPLILGDDENNVCPELIKSRRPTE